MLILASQSPRRRELLGLITPWFRVAPTGCDETLFCANPEEHARQLAMRKAQAALSIVCSEAKDAVIAADTIVSLNGDLLEKPSSPQQAREMLSRLSGREHSVFTGVTVAYAGALHTFVQQTQVTFYSLTFEQIDRYVSTGEPLDKAGAYGIQGKGSLLVEKINGDYFNVVGLPVARLARLLNELGVPLKKEAAL